MGNTASQIELPGDIRFEVALDPVTKLIQLAIVTIADGKPVAVVGITRRVANILIARLSAGIQRMDDEDEVAPEKPN